MEVLQKPIETLRKQVFEAGDYRQVRTLSCLDSSADAAWYLERIKTDPWLIGIGILLAGFALILSFCVLVVA